MGLRHLCGASLAALIICAAPSAAQTITPDAGAYLAARSAGKAADYRQRRPAAQSAQRHRACADAFAC